MIFGAEAAIYALVFAVPALLLEDDVELDWFPPEITSAEAPSKVESNSSSVGGPSSNSPSVGAVVFVTAAGGGVTGGVTTMTGGGGGSGTAVTKTLNEYLTVVAPSLRSTAIWCVPTSPASFGAIVYLFEVNVMNDGRLVWSCFIVCTVIGEPSGSVKLGKV